MPATFSTAAIRVRHAEPADWAGIWPIFRAVVAAGDTYAFALDTTEETARALWTAPPARAYVATAAEGEIVGTYFLKPNQPGLGSHVANAGFMVAPQAAGRGIGRALAEHALHEARASGCRAMQFNYVVSTNTRAVALWQALGFKIIGTVPAAFQHRPLGRLVDVHIMHRIL
jgi:ribosomal protein S18 acetylase RimI-like enzyme